MSSNRSPRVHAFPGWRRAALWPLAQVLRVWARTLRIELSDRPDRRLPAIHGPVIFALWHNRLFIAAEMFRLHQRNRDVYGLVSGSRDGAWLDAFFSLVGIRSVRGSSSRGGREAAKALVEVLRAGHDIGVTPDGPRGPRYGLKAGVLVIARRAEVPLVLLGAAYEAAWVVRSWDRLYLPLPFSRVKVWYDVVRPESLDDATVEDLQARLMALSPDGETNSVQRAGVVI